TAFVNGLSRPAWYSKPGDETMDTRDYMLNHPEKFGSKLGTVTDPFTNLLLRLWKCVCCGHATTYDGVHLGHITKWKVDLIAAGVTTAAEARAAYNNLNNLRIECSTCNASHDEE
ncbi:GH-E family nuclease, partial [Prosthecobacter sp.]|uniref:GH-E family nuclease n=1 Tax=Prosthecobacter sp. TaxID=1965333 RepID=UPI002486F08E